MHAVVERVGLPQAHQVRDGRRLRERARYYRQAAERADASIRQMLIQIADDFEAIA
jgi:hypothetical protein